MNGQAKQANASDAPAFIVRRLLGVVARRSPFDVAEAILSDTLVVYMDGRKLSTQKLSWFSWVRFLHRNADKKNISDLDISIDRISTEVSAEAETNAEVNADACMVRVEASWHGVTDGRALTSSMGAIKYRVVNGKVTEIHTHKANYIFIYGPRIENSLIFYSWVLRMMLWQLFSSAPATGTKR